MKDNKKQLETLFSNTGSRCINEKLYAIPRFLGENKKANEVFLISFLKYLQYVEIMLKLAYTLYYTKSN